MKGDYYMQGIKSLIGVLLVLLVMVLCGACSNKNEAVNPNQALGEWGQSIKHPFKFKLGQRVKTIKSKDENSFFTGCQGIVYGAIDLEGGAFYLVALDKCPNIKQKFTHKIRGGEEFFEAAK